MKRTWGAIFLGLVLVAACGSAKPAVTPAPKPTAAKPVAKEVAAPAPTTPELPALPPLPTSPVARPSNVAVVVVAPTVRALMNAIATHADELGTLVTALRLDMDLADVANFGLLIDLDKPARVVMSKPTDPLGENNFVVVAGVGADMDVSDLDRRIGASGLRVQRRDHEVVFGTSAAIAELGGYAVTTLLAEPVPANISATVWGSKFVGSPPEALPDVDESTLDPKAAKLRLLKKALATSKEFGQKMGRQILEIRGELLLDDPAPPRVRITMAVDPDGQVAAYLAAQRVGDFRIFDELLPSTVMAGGHYDLKMLTGPLLEIIASGSADSRDGMKILWASVGVARGSGVTAAGDPGIRLTRLEKPAALAKSLRAYVLSSSFDVKKIAVTKYKKVNILTSTSALPVPMSYAVVKNWLVSAPSLDLMKAQIDRIVKKDHASSDVAAAVARAKTRGDIALILIKPSADAALWEMGIRISNNELHTEFTLPLPAAALTSIADID